MDPVFAMARIVPYSVPSKASEGEKKLFKILHYELPDDFYVWYEAIVRGRYPDFVIVSPTFGILILDVREWYSAHLTLASDGHSILFRKANEPEKRINPVQQCQAFLDIIATKLGLFDILKQEDGQLAFPIGYGVIFSNLAQSQAYEKGLNPLLSNPQVVFRDEFLSWDTVGEKRLIKRLEQFQMERQNFTTLSPEQLSTINGIMHPETAIRLESAPRSPAQGSNSTDLVIRTLDHRQETLAKSIGEGHRIFYGVAGSGKTLLLLSRAKLLMDYQPEESILILCFNISLAAYLRSLLHQDPYHPEYQKIEVMHFNGWAKLLLGRFPNPNALPENTVYDIYLGELILNELAAHPEKRWHSILVDEAHTFEPIWFRCCVTALQDPEHGNLMIVADANQGLYKRSRFTWESVGVKASGRSQSSRFHLRDNYRNTREILTASCSVIKPLSFTFKTDSEDPPFPALEPTPGLRSGSLPVLHSRQTPLDVVKVIEQLQTLGYPLSEIALLYRRADTQTRQTLQEIMHLMKHYSLSYYWVTENEAAKAGYTAKVPGVRVITALSSLGLEFKAVILIGLEQFADCLSKDPEEAAAARKLLYVAMTRAQDRLHLFSRDPNAWVAELAASGHFQEA